MSNFKKKNPKSKKFKLIKQNFIVKKCFNFCNWIKFLLNLFKIVKKNLFN